MTALTLKQLPISIYQKRFWLEWAIDPESSAYNISALYKIQGELNKAALKKACEVFTRQHEVVHSRFSADGAQCHYASYNIDDFYCESMFDVHQACREQLINLLNIPFDLTNEPLLRFYLVQHEKTYYFIINMQHIIADAVFIEVMTNEISANYNALVDETLIPSSDAQSFTECVNFERSLVCDIKEQEARNFWKDYIGNMSLHVNLPLKSQCFHNDKEGEAVYFETTSAQTEAIKKIAKYNRTTLFIVLSALYAVLLSKYTNQKELVISYPINMRPRGYSKTVGCFVNNVPLKVVFDHNNESLVGLINNISQQRKRVKKHQWYSLTNIIQDQRQVKGRLEQDYFNVGFVEANLNVAPLKLHGLHTENVEMPWNSQSIYQLCLQYDPRSGDTLKFKLEYQKNKIEAFIISSFVDSFKTLLEKAANENICLRDYSPYSSDDYQKIISQWGQYSHCYQKSKTLHQLFEAQVEKMPDNIALVDDSGRLSYREVNQRANQLAHYIRARYEAKNGCFLLPDTFIALYLERGIDMVVSILAVLKAGGAYVPIALENPNSRVSYFLLDTKADFILTQKGQVSKLEECVEQGQQRYPTLIAVDSDNYSEESKANLPIYSKPADLAYVIYTSGTTGNPKGVMQTHGNVMRLFTATEEDFCIISDDVWALYHSYAFDFSVWEIWGALIYGGKLFIPTDIEVKDIPQFYQLCVQHGVTVLNQTPTAFYQFMKVAIKDQSSGLACLRYIIFGGEALNTKLLEPWWQHSKAKNLSAKLINMYGITETTVHVTFKQLSNVESDQSNIGRPIRDLTAYVLNDKLQFVPIGVTGELYVGGAGLARGYLSNSELTRERFIKNPFDNKGDARLYKTGDLVRYLPNGELEYLGRNDSQVKVRGYRIELGEIENALVCCVELGQSCVAIKEVGQDKELICFYTCSIGNKELQKVKNKIKSLLPEYMVPSYWKEVSKIPLTLNGKIDCNLLSSFSLADVKHRQPLMVTKLQQKIITLWQEVLNRADIGLDDNFFDVGGHSIKLLTLHAKFKETFNIHGGSVLDLFECPTVRSYASYISKKHPFLLDRPY